MLESDLYAGARAVMAIAQGGIDGLRRLIIDNDKEVKIIGNG